MKSARERAQEVFASLDRTAQLAIKYDGGGVDAWMARTELSFKEHARDQRHACAESARDRLIDAYRGNGGVNEYALANKAHGFVVNAPAPGE